MESILPAELLQDIRDLLSEPLEDLLSDVLRKQLVALELCRVPLAGARTDGYRKLLAERQRLLLPKDKEYTDLDRTTLQRGALSVLESDYEYLVAIEGIIKDRLELGSLFLQVM